MTEQTGLTVLSWAIASRSESRHTTFALCSGNCVSSLSSVNITGTLASSSMKAIRSFG